MRVNFEMINLEADPSDTIDKMKAFKTHDKEGISNKMIKSNSFHRHDLWRLNCYFTTVFLFIFAQHLTNFASASEHLISSVPLTSSASPFTSSSSITFYADNGQDQTIAYKLLPSEEKDDMQREILNLLGLEHRPSLRSHDTRNSAPRYLIDLYESFLDEETGNLKVGAKAPKVPVILEGEVLDKNSLMAINDSDTIMSFIDQFHRFAPHLRHDFRHRQRRLWFDLSDVDPDQVLMDSELRIYYNSQRIKVPRNLTYTLSVYSVTRSPDKQKKVLNLVGTNSLEPSGRNLASGWIMFNVTEPFLTWLSFPKQNLGLYLRVTIDGSNQGVRIDPQDLGLVSSNGPVHQQPFMISYFKNAPTKSPKKKNGGKKKKKGRGKRGIASGEISSRSGSPPPSSPSSSSRKRQRSDISYYDHDEWNPYLNPHDRYSSGRSCQRRTLYVSFRDLGWQDWIIAPDGYAAFFCHGECSFPLTAHMNATNHAIVQTLVHLMFPYEVPKPCCAPTKLSAIMVLYFDDNSNVILKKYKNMVVKSCGCH